METSRLTTPAEHSARTEASRANRLRKALSEIGRAYHDSACPEALVLAVAELGFDGRALDGIYCGRDGRAEHRISPKVTLVHVWHRMEVTGRYEVTCYLA